MNVVCLDETGSSKNSSTATSWFQIDIGGFCLRGDRDTTIGIQLEAVRSPHSDGW
jgi:hypothetical protein